MNKKPILLPFLMICTCFFFTVMRCAQSSKPLESDCRPVIVLSGDSIVFAPDSTRYVISDSGHCSARRYVWSFNNGASFTDTTMRPAFLKHWSEADTGVRMIVACALTQAGETSFPETLSIRVMPCIPTVGLNGASEALPLDTTRLTVSGASKCGAIALYLWSFNGGVSFDDSGPSNYVIKQWGAGDTGLFHILVKAISSTGEASLADSSTVRVRSDINPVQLPHDTTVRAQDTIAIIARVLSQVSSISRFFWTVDHAAQETPTIGNTLRCSWPPGAAGVHVVKVRATDDRMTGYVLDSMAVNVVTQSPSLVHPRDTLVSRTDTILVTLHASDSGAQIVTYLWNVGGLSWTDSTKTPRYKISYFGKDTVTIGVGVCDNHGATVVDSFHIYYNAPPENIRMLLPTNGDTILFHTIDSTFFQKRVAFRFTAFDRNGAMDSLSFSLYLGKSPGLLEKIYEGRDSLFIAGNIDTAHYFWRLAAHDKFGDSVSCAGTFMTLLQQTICFAGHSIVSGFFCDSGSGGFRKKVLSGLRSSFGNDAKVKAVGPLVTNFMAKSPDDSCFAVGGYTAKDLYLLMENSFPALNADLWVIMLGINGNYNSTELRSLMNILNAVHANNSQAGIYVINGLPYAPLSGQDQVFNAWLSDSIAAKKNLSWKISCIDAYHKFALDDYPNPALFTPESPAMMHPNQAGYDTLANLILSTMGITMP